MAAWIRLIWIEEKFWIEIFPINRTWSCRSGVVGEKIGVGRGIWIDGGSEEASFAARPKHCHPGPARNQDEDKYKSKYKRQIQKEIQKTNTKANTNIKRKAYLLTGHRANLHLRSEDRGIILISFSRFNHHLNLSGIVDGSFARNLKETVVVDKGFGSRD